MRPISGDRDVDRATEFDRFFDREALGQMRRAVLLVGSEEEAADIVQEAFVRVWQRWSDLDGPGAYLNRVVLNLCRDHGRRRRRQGHLLRRLRHAPSSDGDHEHLDDVLARLPFNQRASIVLRFWGGHTTEEIAAALDCAPGSVGPWIRRGLDTSSEELR